MWEWDPVLQSERRTAETIMSANERICGSAESTGLERVLISLWRSEAHQCDRRHSCGVGSFHLTCAFSPSSGSLGRELIVGIIGHTSETRSYLSNFNCCSLLCPVDQQSTNSLTNFLRRLAFAAFRAKRVSLRFTQDYGLYPTGVKTQYS